MSTSGLICAILSLLCSVMHGSEQIHAASKKMDKAPAVLCNEECVWCAPIQEIFEKDIPQMPPVLVALIMGYVKHFETITLFNKPLTGHSIGEPVTIPFWDNEPGPRLTSVEKALRVPFDAELELFRVTSEGYQYPPRESFLDPQYKWFYQITHRVPNRREFAFILRNRQYRRSAAR